MINYAPRYPTIDMDPWGIGTGTPARKRGAGHEGGVGLFIAVALLRVLADDNAAASFITALRRYGDTGAGRRARGAGTRMKWTWSGCLPVLFVVCGRTRGLWHRRGARARWIGLAW